MRRTRSTEKALVQSVILGVLLLGATGEETRTTGTPLGWAIFWIICAALGLSILKNLNTPSWDYSPPKRRSRQHHRRITRREAREYRRVR